MGIVARAASCNREGCGCAFFASPVNRMMMRLKRYVTQALVAYLTRKVRRYEPFAISSADDMAASLQVGDVLLVDGNQKFSTAVKYLTQSTWSHAALFVGAARQLGNLADGTPALVEADLENGVIAVPLEKYDGFNTRICRPAGLDESDRRSLVRFMLDSIGLQYDLKNVTDLARYLIPTPPVPTRWRRQMLALGSGDPTRAICSTRIAQAFQSIGYPILPEIETIRERRCSYCEETVRQVMHIRHHSLFTPRDFDVSPYFEIVKPSLHRDFDHRKLTLREQPDPLPEPGAAENIL